MRNVILAAAFLVLAAGCATAPRAEKESAEGQGAALKEELIGGSYQGNVDREFIRNSFREPEGIYISDTETAEIWFYDDFYVSFLPDRVLVNSFDDAKD